MADILGADENWTAPEHGAVSTWLEATPAGFDAAGVQVPGRQVDHGPDDRG